MTGARRARRVPGFVHGDRRKNFLGSNIILDCGTEYIMLF
jgi:hypothetical protein